MKKVWRRIKFYRSSQWKMIISIVVLLLVLVRIALSPALVTFTNHKLENLSHEFTFHLEDLDLRLWRGEYVLRGLSGAVRSTGESLFSIKDITVMVPLLDVLKGKIIGSLSIDTLELNLSEDILHKSKGEIQRIKNRLAKSASREMPRMYIENISLYNSEIHFQDLLTTHKNMSDPIADLDIEIHNLIPTKVHPLTSFEIAASVLGPTPFRAIGGANLKQNPFQWHLNAEMKNLNLLALDRFFQKRWGVEIFGGKADLNMELNSVDGEIYGYIKPLITGLKMKNLPHGEKIKQRIERQILTELRHGSDKVERQQTQEGQKLP